jgi:hypothetical protein
MSLHGLQKPRAMYDGLHRNHALAAVLRFCGLSLHTAGMLW